MKKDYYEVLGIAKGASAEDIKKAYRKLAREHHPDMVKETDKKHAEERFKEINEAYQVLGDTEKKQMYDQYGHTANHQGSSGQQGQWGPFSYSYNAGGQGAQFDPMDIFEEFFGFGRGFGSQRQPRKGKDLAYDMSIEFAEAVHGAIKEVTVESGAVKINIPQGARTGTELRFQGKGMKGPEGVPNGDLYITLRVPTPKEFQRAGDNLGTLINVDFTQAILGDTIEVPVIETQEKSGLGKANLKIPSGTQSGTQFRVKGRGMPKLQGRGQGDVIVQVNVVIPKSINKKQRKILEEYRDSV